MRLLDADSAISTVSCDASARALATEPRHFQAEIVPKLWVLTKKVRSGFSAPHVPEILRVLTGLNVNYETSGTYYQRLLRSAS
jgi:hypothetical protein